MSVVTATKNIAAPIGEVFDAVADVRNFSQIVEDIVRIEFLSESQVGVGTRFRETRLMKGKEQFVELEVTEYEPNQHVRLVSDEGGTIWDTVFTVTDAGNGLTTLNMHMDCRPYKFFMKLMVPLIKGTIAKAVEGDMEAVKRHCESTD